MSRIIQKEELFTKYLDHPNGKVVLINLIKSENENRIQVKDKDGNTQSLRDSLSKELRMELGILLSLVIGDANGKEYNLEIEYDRIEEPGKEIIYTIHFDDGKKFASLKITPNALGLNHPPRSSIEALSVLSDDLLDRLKAAILPKLDGLAQMGEPFYEITVTRSRVTVEARVPDS